MSQSSKKQSVALSSVFASAGLTLIKFIVGILSGSIGVISEAAHSALDLGAALLTYFAVKNGDKPADEKHHYGHAKIESVSALIATGLLFLTSIWIIYESLNRLLFKNVAVETSWYTFAVIIVSIIIDVSRSRALTKVAKETNSQALEADALHFSSDILSSIVVLIGLAIVALGIQSADSYAAIGVSLFVFYTGIKLGKRTIDVLLDTAPEGIREKIVEIVKKDDEVVDIEKVRARHMGSTTFVDLTVYVSRKLSLVKSNAISDRLIKKVRDIIPETDMTVHTKPLPLNNETIVERIRICALKHDLQVHDIIVHLQDGRKFINFHLEVDAKLLLKKAHEIASHLEDEIRSEIGEAEINTHIEPIQVEPALGKNINSDEEARIVKIILAQTEKIPSIEGAHNIKIRETRGKIFISFHCLFKNDTSVETAHNITSRLEYLIKEHLPELQRIVIHDEPV
jgi:cation diffusion facilitator family transporter